MKRFSPSRLLLIATALLPLGLHAQKIAVLNDLHVGPGNKAAEKLVEAVNEINAQEFDAVIVNGDLSNEGSDTELTYVKGILDGVNHPFFIVPGNHENNWSQSAGATFVNLWGDDRFSTVIDSLLIVGINCGPYMKMGDGHVKQEDLHWLESVMANTPGYNRVLSINHYPIRKDDLDNYIEYTQVLSPYPVIAHVNGHYHIYERYQAGDIEAVMTRALIGRDGSAGYSILDIKPDSIFIYEKLIGEEPALKYTIPVKTKHTAPQAIVDSVFETPHGFEITKLWTDSASIFTRLGVDTDNVYFGTSTGRVKAIDKKTGDLAYDIPLYGCIYSRPVVLGRGKVAFPSILGIRTIEPDGTSTRIKAAGSPYVADGLVEGDIYYQGGYKRFEAFDRNTGELIWEYDSIDNYCQAAPAIDGNDLVFGCWDTYLRCLDKNTGKLKWKWNNGRKANMLGPGNVVPVITGNHVIIVAPDRYITAIDRTTGETVWRDNSYKYRESLGRNAAGTIAYAKTMDGQLVAVDPLSDEFKVLWVSDMGLGYEHAPCIVAELDGVVYAGSRRGIVTALDAETGDVLFSTRLGSGEINGLDIDPEGGSVFLSLVDGTVFRIDRK